MATIFVIAFSGTQNSGAGEPLALSANRPEAAPEHCPGVQRALAFYTKRLQHWTSLRTGVGNSTRTAGSRSEGSQRSSLRACPRYLLKIRQAKARAAHKAYVAWHRWYVALYEKWRCIHEHEGAWNSNTGNGYWGGLQMDWGFMHTYGPEFIRRYGLAHRWPVYAQLIAAERAFYGFAGYGGRGYSPWGTRGACGV